MIGDQIDVFAFQDLGGVTSVNVFLREAPVHNEGLWRQRSDVPGDLNWRWKQAFSSSSLAIEAYHRDRDLPVQSPGAGKLPLKLCCSSLPVSQARIDGSSPYRLPVMVFTRLSRNVKMSFVLCQCMQVNHVDLRIGTWIEPLTRQSSRGLFGSNSASAWRPWHCPGKLTCR